MGIHQNQNQALGRERKGGSNEKTGQIRSRDFGPYPIRLRGLAAARYFRQGKRSGSQLNGWQVPQLRLHSLLTVPAQTKPDTHAYIRCGRSGYIRCTKTQIELHAVVSGTLTELGLKQLFQKLYDEANATRGFKYHGGKPIHVFIYLYTSRDHFKTGMGQWIAMLSQIGEGSRIDTQVKTELIAQLDGSRKSSTAFRNRNVRRYSEQSSRLKTVLMTMLSACTHCQIPVNLTTHKRRL